MNRSLLAGIGAVLWLTICLIGYIYLHKPFTPELLIALATYLWQFICASGIVLVSGGIGAFITRNFSKFFEDFSSQVLQSALGLGILGLLVFTIGVFSVSKQILGTLFLASLIILKNDIQNWISGWKFNSIKPETAFQRACALLVIVMAGLSLLACFTPPLKFDALTYHLALPNAYTLAGKILYIPENIFWGMPQQTEMSYLLGSLLGGVQTSVILGWMVGVLTIYGTLEFISININKTAGWVAAACFFSGQTFSSSLSWAYTDWHSAFYGFAFLITFIKWMENKNNAHLILAGIFAGFAMGTKYTSGMIGLIGLVIILCSGGYSNVKGNLKNIFLFGITAFLIFSPWLLKNLLETQNPIYPLLFPAGSMDEIRIFKYHRSPADIYWWRILTLPWDATIWGVEGGAGGYSASIGPLWLSFGALAWINLQKRAQVQKKLIYTAAAVLCLGFLIWSIGSQFAGLLIQTRLYFVLFPAWAILASAGYSVVSSFIYKTIRFERIVNALVLLPLIFNSLTAFKEFETRGVMLNLLTIQTDADYLNSNLGEYQTAMAEIAGLPAESKVLMLWEPRGYYCMPICDSDEIIDRWYHDWRMYHDTNSILNLWMEENYTHVIYYKRGADFIRETDINKYIPDDWQGLDEMLKLLGEPIKDFEGQYLLFKIK